MGQPYPLDLHVSEMRLPDGRLFAGIVSDISERKKAEEQRRKQQWELAAVSRMTTIGGLATAIAHELNQPLTRNFPFAASDAAILPNPCLISRPNCDSDENVRL